MATQTTDINITTNNAGASPAPARLPKGRVSEPQESALVTCQGCTWLEALEGGGVGWCGRQGQFRHIDTGRRCADRLAD